MQITDREFWTLVHGMGFGAAYLLAFAGGLAGLYSLSPKLVTAEGITERVRRLRFGIVIMAALVWLTVIVGTYVVYPWYRAAPPKADTQGNAIVTDYKNDPLKAWPKAWLIAKDQQGATESTTAEWHNFGMEWKEHVAWFAPLLATVVAFAVLRFGKQLSQNRSARYMIMTLFLLSFVIAGIAGMLGALITKAAPLT